MITVPDELHHAWIRLAVEVLDTRMTGYIDPLCVEWSR